MAGDIFLLQDNHQLIEMTEQAYATEALLQELLANYPNLLAGKQITPSEPRRWLLISREMPVPLGETYQGWAAVDHLFLDQDGIPTLVEVKRSSDTRIRREVIGQMIDYAANAAYWPLELIISRFETRCAEQRADPSEMLETRLGIPVTEHNKFWDTVKTNLKAGNLRLIFVADEIPASLQRAVEFLNEQMEPAEVLAIEIKQYEGPGLKTLVPRVLGQTAEAQQRKNISHQKNKWDEETFLSDLQRRRGNEEMAEAQRILEWARSHQVRIWWGEGTRSGSFVPILDHNGVKYQLFALYTYGSLEIYFQYYQAKPLFDQEAKRLEMLAKFNAIPGINLPPDAINRRPSIPLAQLLDSTVRTKFLAVFEWFINEVRN